MTFILYDVETLTSQLRSFAPISPHLVAVTEVGEYGHGMQVMAFSEQDA